MAANPAIPWPEGKSFAFTIFDDTDSQTLEKGRAVYSLLADHGFRTTKSVWPIRGKGEPSDIGATCEDAEYRRWVQSLQELGFEIGYHMATSHTSQRADTLRALEQFASYFGHYPVSMANHYFCDENLYFGDARVTGPRPAGLQPGHTISQPQQISRARSRGSPFLGRPMQGKNQVRT